MIVSVIIVNYHVKKELLACIFSILAFRTKNSFEIIVVDNDEKNEIEKDLKHAFPQIRYIKSSQNLGYSTGNNLGASVAKGKFLFFLNPDTVFSTNVLDPLLKFLTENKEAGIVAPLLLDKEKKPFVLQGTRELTPLRAIFSITFLHRLFPNNPIAKKYWLSKWDKKTIKEVDVCPGTAFLIEKDLFEKVGRFDEKFFLFFEEFDFCKRVKKLRYTIFIHPEARIIHLWGRSTANLKNNKEIFLKSRFRYFRKHFGLFAAVIVEVISRIGKTALLLGSLIVLGAVLRLYRLYDHMSFIGDQGWFYLSARDMLLTGQIPLVGITSSHTWLHQGALWTYLLGIVLWLFNFNPLSGGYLSVGIDITTVFFIYKLGKEMVGGKVGIVASSLYAVSPLAIFFARMPYHTSPIPLFTALYLYGFYKVLKGNYQFTSLIFLSLGFLYNFELATAILWLPVIIFFFLQAIRKKIKKIFTFKIFLLSSLGLLIPMLPMIIYDFSHFFVQTFGFSLWILYKILVFFGLPPLSQSVQQISYQSLFVFLGESYKKLLFPNSVIITSLIFLASFFVIRKKYFTDLTLLLFGLELILIIGFLLARTPSEAYLPMFFVPTILLTAVTFSLLFQSKIKAFGIFFFLSFIITNVHFILSNNYLFHNQLQGYGFSDRIRIASEIVKKAKGREYTLKGFGEGSQFASFTDNYQYLTWYLGNEAKDEKRKLQFSIYETKHGIIVKEQYDK